MAARGVSFDFMAGTTKFISESPPRTVTPKSKKIGVHRPNLKFQSSGGKSKSVKLLAANSSGKGPRQSVRMPLMTMLTGPSQQVVPPTIEDDFMVELQSPSGTIVQSFFTTDPQTTGESSPYVDDVIAGNTHAGGRPSNRGAENYFIQFGWPTLGDRWYELLDDAAVPYELTISRKGKRYFRTRETTFCSTFLKCITLAYVIYILIGFWREKNIQYESTVEAREGEERISSDVFDILEVKNSVLPFMELAGLYTVVIGADFYYDEEHNEMMRFRANCTGYSHNLPPDLSELAGSLAEAHFNRTKDGNFCNWGGQYLGNSDIAKSTYNVLVVYYISLDCVLPFKQFRTSMASYLIAPNPEGYSKVTMEQYWTLQFENVHYLNYLISTVGIKKHSKWYPFWSSSSEQYYTFPRPDMWNAGVEATMRATTPNNSRSLPKDTCMLNMVIDLDQVVNVQELWPESIVGAAARIGGFFAVVSACIVILKLYNQLRQPIPDMMDYEELQRLQNPGEFLEEEFEKFRTVTQSRSQPRPECVLGQVYMESYGCWLPAKLYNLNSDEDEKPFAQIKGNIIHPELRNELIHDLEESQYKLDPVIQLSGDMRPKRLKDAFERESDIATIVEIENMRGDKSYLNGKTGQLMELEKGSRDRWIVNVCIEEDVVEEHTIKEHNLGLQNKWIPVDLELVATANSVDTNSQEGYFRAREQSNLQLHIGVRPKDIRVNRRMSSSFTQSGVSMFVSPAPLDDDETETSSELDINLPEVISSNDQPVDLI